MRRVSEHSTPETAYMGVKKCCETTYEESKDQSPDDEGPLDHIVGRTSGHELLKVLPEAPGYEEENYEMPCRNVDLGR